MYIIKPAYKGKKVMDSTGSYLLVETATQKELKYLFDNGHKDKIAYEQAKTETDKSGEDAEDTSNVNEQIGKTSSNKRTKKTKRQADKVSCFFY